MKGPVSRAGVFASAAVLASVLGSVAPPARAQFWNPWQQQSSPWGQPPPRQALPPRQPTIHRRPAPRPLAHTPSPARQQPGTPQNSAKPETAPAAVPTTDQPVVEGPPPPYEPQLLRLSEILGALSYLRDICSAHDGDAWRGKMSTLLDAEAKTQTRRERLAGAFNRGFRGYEVIYRTCTPNAETVIARYLNEGGRL